MVKSVQRIELKTYNEFKFLQTMFEPFIVSANYDDDASIGTFQLNEDLTDLFSIILNRIDYKLATLLKRHEGGLHANC